MGLGALYGRLILLFTIMVIDRIQGRSKNIITICNIKIQNETFIQVNYLQKDNMLISFPAAKERKLWISVLKVSFLTLTCSTESHAKTMGFIMQVFMI